MFAKITAFIKKTINAARINVLRAKKAKEEKSFSEMPKADKVVYCWYLFAIFLTAALLSFGGTYLFMSQVAALVIGGFQLKPFLILCSMGFVIGVSAAAIEERIEKTEAA